jgi:hypothetical protein
MYKKEFTLNVGAVLGTKHSALGMLGVPHWAASPALLLSFLIMALKQSFLYIFRCKKLDSNGIELYKSNYLWSYFPNLVCPTVEYFKETVTYIFNIYLQKSQHDAIFYRFNFFVVLEIEPRALCMV